MRWFSFGVLVFGFVVGGRWASSRRSISGRLSRWSKQRRRALVSLVLVLAFPQVLTPGNRSHVGRTEGIRESRCSDPRPTLHIVLVLLAAHSPRTARRQSSLRAGAQWCGHAHSGFIQLCQGHAVTLFPLWAQCGFQGSHEARLQRRSS